MDGSSDKAKVDPGDTARIDRRKSVLAQIEAALLADKLAIEELRERGGGDPYNTAATGSDRVASSGVWNARRPR
nr:MAG: hypothetical protein DIU62_08510 [Pseudomonadota bacterium]